MRFRPSWHRLLLLSVLVVGPLVAARPASSILGPWHRRPEARLRLVVEDAVALEQGQGVPIRMGLEFVTEKGWHVYWKNPGDAGFPMQVESRSAELRDLRLGFPAPHRFALPGGLQAFGYEGSVVYPLDGVLAARAGATSGLLALGVDYLVCEIECIPYREELRVEVPLTRDVAGAARDPDAALLLDAWRERLPKPATTIDGLTVVATRVPAPANGEVVALFTVAATHLDSAEAGFFLETHPDVDFGPIERRSHAANTATFSVPLRPHERRPEGLGTIELAWTLTGLAAAVAAEGTSRVAAPDGRASAPRAEPANGGPSTSIGAFGAIAPLAVVAGAATVILLLLFIRLRRTP